MPQKAYDELKSKQHEATVLGSVSGLLGWDQETMMPKDGTPTRAEQSAVMSGVIHDRVTDPAIGALLGKASAGNWKSDSIEAANLREWQRDYDRERKLPKAHVEEVARTQAISQAEWAKARKASDFAHFAPHLKKILDLTRKTAEYYGWADDGEAYDALLEGYEPGATAKEVEEAFAPLREDISELIKATSSSTTQPDGSIHAKTAPKAQQMEFVHFISESIGFNYDRGRLDESTHPFCSGAGPGDCRMTTRFTDDYVMDALGSTMHETGHGIYEQNLTDDAWGTPCGEATSLGIHESQSRTWENQVGRSHAFWNWCMPHAQRMMPELMAGETADSMYAAQNIVKPSFIRVESDETTYNLHIMLRFKLERAMLRGELEVDDIPAAWNREFKESFGIDVDKDSNGCLQDVHWSFGLMGYFPTYTLGNLYSAQFFDAAREQVGDLDGMFAKGEFEPLREWLTENIHQHGRRYRASELCKRITGKSLSHKPLVAYLQGKIRPLYGLS